MLPRTRMVYAVFLGYLADLTLGWLAVWLAPHTGDLTYRVYMAPGEWFVDPLRAPFAALLFWTAIFALVWYLVVPQITRFRSIRPDHPITR